MRRRFSTDFVHADRLFRVDGGVFDPVQHLSGIAFATFLETLDWTDQRVLDLGTGTGLLAAVLHDAGAAVVASDVNKLAVSCASQNLADTSVQVLHGDLFSAVVADHFDTIVVNPPYERGRSLRPSLRSPDMLHRLAKEWRSHGDRLLLAFPTDTTDVLDDSGFTLELVARIETAGRELGVFSSSD